MAHRPGPGSQTIHHPGIHLVRESLRTLLGPVRRHRRRHRRRRATRLENLGCRYGCPRGCPHGATNHRAQMKPRAWAVGGPSASGKGRVKTLSRVTTTKKKKKKKKGHLPPGRLQRGDGAPCQSRDRREFGRRSHTLGTGRPCPRPKAPPECLAKQLRAGRGGADQQTRHNLKGALWERVEKVVAQQPT